MSRKSLTPIQLPADPTLPLEAATKQYVDAGAGAVANDSITNLKLANMPANTIKGNNTASTADPADLTVAQTKTLLAIASTDVSGLGTLATQSTVNLSTQATGVLQAAQEPAHTGDVTNTAGNLALTIAAAIVANSKLANMTQNTIKGRVTASTGVPEDLTAAQAVTVISSGSGGGTTNFLRADGTWNAPTASLANNSVTNAILADMAANSFKGNNTGSAADPIDLTVAQAKTLLAITTADFTGVTTAAQEPAHTGDVTNSAGSLDLQIVANAVTNTDLADMVQSTIKGRAAGAGTGDPTDLTAAQLATVMAGALMRMFSVSCAAATSTVANHAFNTRNVLVDVYRNTTPWDSVECDVERTDVNNVTVRFAVAPAAGDYVIAVVG
jgi:hypothetical protein